MLVLSNGLLLTAQRCQGVHTGQIQPRSLLTQRTQAQASLFQCRSLTVSRAACCLSGLDVGLILGLLCTYGRLSQVAQSTLLSLGCLQCLAVARVEHLGDLSVQVLLCL